MKKQITVSELKKQLEILESMGKGDNLLWYRDETSMDWRIEEGIWDSWENHIYLA